MFFVVMADYQNVGAMVFGYQRVDRLISYRIMFALR